MVRVVLLAGAYLVWAGVAWPMSGEAGLDADAVVGHIAADLERLPAGDRRFARYVSLVHFQSAGAAGAALATYRRAVSKLCNSLSWAERIVPPTPIDAAGAILRLDLRA